MANKVIASLSALLTLDPKGFKDGLNKSKRHVSQFEKSINSIGPAIAAAFSVAAITEFAKRAIMAYDASERAQAKVAQAVKKTGQAAGFTADELFKMAVGLQKITNFEDDEILNKVTAQLLSFPLITKKVFADAQKAILDVATLLDGDIQSSAIAIGKALQDPVKGITAMRRMGIMFNTQQTETIRLLVEQGNLYRAQELILEEINRQYGGQAEALAKVGIGKYRQMWLDLGNAMEIAGKWLLNFVDGTLQLGNAINNLTWKPIYALYRKIFPELIPLTKESTEAMKQWGESFMNVANMDAKFPGMEVSPGGKGKQPGAIEAIKDRIKALTTAIELVPESKIAAINIELKQLNIELERLQNLGLGGGEKHPIEMLSKIDTSAASTQLQELTQSYYDLAIAQGLATQSTGTSAAIIEENSNIIESSMNRIGDSMGDALADFAKGEKTFKETAFDMIGSIIKIIAGYLAQSVASAFAGGASAGGPFAAVTGAAAAGAAAAAFGSVVPALMATGGTVPGGFPGDTYPAMLSSGETVIPAPIPLGGFSSGGGQVEFVIRGENLYGTWKKQQSKQDRYK